MPYKNIIFVKLEKRLLNDSRWWTMSSYAQLLYVKMLMLAAENRNKITIDPSIFRQSVRCELPLSEFVRCVEEVLNNFTRIKRISCNGKEFYYFSNFHEYTNYIPKKEKLGKSLGSPKDALDKSKKKIRIEEEAGKPYASHDVQNLTKNIGTIRYGRDGRGAR